MSSNSTVYDFEADTEGPITANVLANPVAINNPAIVTANVDDSTTGGSNIASAEYSRDGGPWTAMDAADGTFDEVSEDVTANLGSFSEIGLKTVCVRGTDAAGNTGAQECTLLAIYDPDGGFVTGGGWIDSPAGAFKQIESVWFQGFEQDREGWVDNGDGTVNREPSGYSNAGGYADGIASAKDSFHARLRTTQTGGCVPPFSQGTTCVGPFTRWGNPTTSNPDFPEGGYATSVDVYLDTVWANGKSDWRFDFSSAINNSAGTHLRDFVFNAGTDPAGGAKFVVNASTNAFRSSSYPSNPCPSPSAPPNTCRTPVEITGSGWYTFRHTFRDDGGSLAVDMEILDQSGGQVAFWTIYSGDAIPIVGGPRYGWFANQEIHDLPIDNGMLNQFQLPTGKANFGFVSKYQKGADTPTGNTEFVFQAAGLNFHSTSYEWLVVNQGGSNAQFKGEGTINGAGSYKFMLWAGDGTGSNGEDTFRIKIWYEDNGEVVIYDNGTDQAIGGGNIVVHKGK